MNPFTEINQESRKQINKFIFRSYMKQMILCMLFMLGAMLFIIIHINYSIKKMEFTHHLLHEVEKVNSNSGRIEVLVQLISNNNIYSILAQFKIAQIYTIKKKYSLSIFYLNKIINNSSVEEIYKSFAELIKFKLQLRSGDVNRYYLIAHLNKFLGKNSFKNIIRLYIASSYITEGLNQKAKEQLNYLLTNPDIRGEIIRFSNVLNSIINLAYRHNV